MMPGYTGMELHAELASSCPEQADVMLFMTGGAFTREGREFLDRTEIRRMDKPFTLHELRNQVGLLAERRLVP